MKLVSYIEGWAKHSEDPLFHKGDTFGINLKVNAPGNSFTKEAAKKKHKRKQSTKKIKL